MFDKLKNIFKKPEPPKKEEPKPKKKELSAKDKATQAGEPYVSILSMELDPKDINSGAFELDWNDKFIANLVRAGYQKRPNEPESDIVDRWFQNVCRNVVLEIFEQQQADPDNRYRNDMRVVNTKDLGDGRTEIS